MRSIQVVRGPGSPAMPRTIVVVLPLLVFSAFLTDTSFISGMATNLGPFEIVGSLTCALLALHMLGALLTFARHPLVDIAIAMLLLAVISQVNVPPERWRWSLIDLAILLYFVVFVAFLYQAVRHYNLSPSLLLRWTTYAILVVGPWIVYEGSVTGGSIGAVGPFRNRAHMGYYMLTAFWIALLFRLWPGIRRWERWAAHAAMALSLYAIAVSGRRSVYLALFVGLAGIALSFVIASRGKRRTLAANAIFLIGSLALFYAYGERYFPRTSFFRERVSMIGDAVAGAIGPAEEGDTERGFVALQRQGALRAVRDHPLLGIGWGGFYRSAYSPTGHEMHSTPLRFLAELGIPGLGLYTAFMLYLLSQTVRLYRMMKLSPYAGTYLVLAIALWSLSLSYLYNRHLSERTFWLLLVLFLALERFALQYQLVLQHVQTVRAGQAAAVPAGGAWPAAARVRAEKPPPGRTRRPRLRPSRSAP